MKNLSVKSSLIASVALVLILVSSVGATAALAAPFPSSAGSAITPDHHKPDHDKGNGNGNKPEKDKGKPDDRSNSGKGKGIGNSPMLKPVPAALGDFELAANGTAIAKRDGRDGPFTDASLVLQATVIREEGNHLRFHATGTVELKGEGEYDIIDAKGIIIFFKNPRGNAVSGLIHIAGKHAVDQDGSDLGKFKLRALVLGQLTDSSWKIIVFPSGKLGKEFLLVNMSGKIDGITGGPNPPPGSSDLSHFLVSAIPSSVVAGAGINVTVTAHMANGTLLKSYEEKAKITDTTESVRPVITPKFKDGVFKGILNITEAISSDKVKFTDVATGKSGESNAFSVTAGPLAKVELSPALVTIGPGEKAGFAAKATDKFGNELSGLTFGWALSTQNFGSIATTGNKANFTASSSITQDVELNLTASAGGMSDMSFISINPETPDVLDHFVIANISSPQTAGSNFQITARAVNASGHMIASYSGPMLLTDSTGSLNMTVSTGFSNGIWTGNVNITEADDDVVITAADMSSPSKNGDSNEFEVVAGALHHFGISQISNQTAGVQFNVIVSARDAFGNLKTDFAGNVTLGTNNGASPAGNSTQFVPTSHNYSAADGGQHTFAVTMYNAAQNVTVSATGSGKSGVSNLFDVRPAAVALVTVSPTSATVSPGGKATFTAEARDSFGNLVTGADFEWSLDPAALGDLDELSATAAEFRASSAIAVTTPGTVTAKVGSVSGTASVTVEV
ncbi:MAG TPA: hypothetical protein VJL54_09675 [Nitrososphaera sp.]|nr:hypothetical protein [Nitrososphaera sp.]